MNVSKELKRDTEVALTQNSTSNAGSTTVARQTRGLEGWIQTNVDAHTGYTAGAYLTDPGTASTDGTQRAFTETLLKTALQSAYTSGGSPELIMVPPAAKQTFSTFTGNSTRFKDADATLNAAISIYVSDFGTLQAVPNRFMATRDVFVLQSDKLAIAYLRPFMTKEIAATGDAEKRELIVEYCLECRAPKAHGAIYDVQ